MKTAKEIALNFSERFQENYPKKPLWEIMVDLEKEIEKYAFEKVKTEEKILHQNSDSSSVAFAKWIGERTNKDSWFKYDARFGKWYVDMKGHLTTEELYELWLASVRKRNYQIANSD